jgi:membrane protease YdiL (CAAX protease family)
VLSLLAGPVGGLALYVGDHLGALALPHARFGWAGLAISLLLAPMLEELVFRGGIQDASIARLGVGSASSGDSASAMF